MIHTELTCFQSPFPLWKIYYHFKTQSCLLVYYLGLDYIQRTLTYTSKLNTQSCKVYSLGAGPKGHANLGASAIIFPKTSFCCRMCQLTNKSYFWSAIAVYTSHVSDPYHWQSVALTCNVVYRDGRTKSRLSSASYCYC